MCAVYRNTAGGDSDAKFPGRIRDAWKGATGRRGCYPFEDHGKSMQDAVFDGLQRRMRLILILAPRIRPYF
jgi:hypothetical protein